MVPLLGEAYAPSAGILRLLIWYTAITMFGNVFSMGLLIQNRQRRILLIRGGGLALNVTLSAILLLHWGDPRGAVIASIIGEIAGGRPVSQGISRNRLGLAQPRPKRNEVADHRRAKRAIVMLALARKHYPASPARRINRLRRGPASGARIER